MIDEKLTAQLEKYVKENYVAPRRIVFVSSDGEEVATLSEDAKFSISGDYGVHSRRNKDQEPMELSDKYDGVVGAIRWKLDKMFDKLDTRNNFGHYLRELIQQKGLTEVEVYKKVNLDRRLFSKLRRDRKYKPSERTIWAIAFALELDLPEAEELMRQGGFAFSDHDKEDLIIKFFFENKIYDLFTINEILDYYKYPTLGG